MFRFDRSRIPTTANLQFRRRRDLQGLASAAESGDGQGKEVGKGLGLEVSQCVAGDCDFLAAARGGNFEPGSV